MFYKHNPLQVYQQLFHFKNEVKQFLFPFDTGMLCYCIDEMQKFNINQLGPIYPGQALAVYLCVNHRVKYSIKGLLISATMFDELLQGSQCRIPLSNKNQTG